MYTKKQIKVTEQCFYCCSSPYITTLNVRRKSVTFGIFYIHLYNHYMAYRKGRRVRDRVVVEFISTCVCTYEISS
jgi:hypothetical protein